MSPFIMGGIGGLARARVAAEREAEATGDHETLKEVMVKMWGWPWGDRRVGEDPLDVEALAARAEQGYELGTVPEGVHFLIVAIDVQYNRFVVQVEGFGVDRERWLVDRFDVVKPPSGHDRLLDPARLAEDWGALEEAVIEKSWPLADDPGRAMKPRLIVYDSQGAPGVTTKAYDFWRAQKRKGRGNRIRPLRGHEQMNAARATVSYPDSHRKDRRAGARGEIPVLRMAVNLLKDDVDAALRRDVPGAGYYHFPHGLDERFYREFGAETREKKGWVQRGRRNEAMDLAAYTTGATILLKADRIDWNRPPDWARRQDDNPFIVAAPSLAATVASDGDVAGTPSYEPEAGSAKPSLASLLA